MRTQIKNCLLRFVMPVFLLFDAGPILNVLQAADHPPTKPIRVAVFADAGVTKTDIPRVKHCLPASQGFDVKTITAEQIRGGDLENFDVLIHPGGSASKQASTLGEKGRLAVKKFVADGGGFIGICAGAYLASAEYPWSLNLLDAHVLDRAHWARGEGEVRLKLSRMGMSALASEKTMCDIHYENGPLLGPGEKDDIDDYEPLAKFETEITKNGAPPGAMKGTTAIARGKFGKGRVVCFSPHPEKTPGREAFLQQATRWAAGLAPMIGQEIVLKGHFGGPGKPADYILTDVGQVFLKGHNQRRADSINYGDEIMVRGKLQRYIASSDRKISNKFDETRAIAPTHYFIESPEVTKVPRQE
jgi:glutamine amidotransferase-like uncharacterized protein